MPDFVWHRLVREGEFVLAQGETRAFGQLGLALLQRDGRVLWTRIRRGRFLNDVGAYIGRDGSVACVSEEGAEVVTTTGTVIDMGDSVPAGPPVHGAVPVRALRDGAARTRLIGSMLGDLGGVRWHHLDGRVTGDAPAFSDDDSNLVPQVRGAQIRIASVLRTHPREPSMDIVYEPVVTLATVGHIRVPGECIRVAWMFSTLAPGKFLVACEAFHRPTNKERLALAPDEPRPTEFRMMVLDVVRRRLLPLDVPGERSGYDSVTVDLDRSGIAIATSDIGPFLTARDASGRWSPWTRLQGDYPLKVGRVCDRLKLREDRSVIVIGAKNAASDVKVFTRQDDGAWLPLPYEVGGVDAACSPGGHRVAFGLNLPSGVGLSIASLDKNQNQTITYEGVEGRQGPGSAPRRVAPLSGTFARPGRAFPSR